MKSETRSIRSVKSDCAGLSTEFLVIDKVLGSPNKSRTEGTNLPSSEVYKLSRVVLVEVPNGHYYCNVLLPPSIASAVKI